MQRATGTRLVAVMRPEVEGGAPSGESADRHASRARFAALLSEPDTPPARTAAAEFTELLQRLCSAVYLGEQPSPVISHMLLTLDAVLPGAAVEFIREGAFLRVRLHARNDAAFRLMYAHCDSLRTVLGDATRLNVSVDVICDEGASDGSAR